MTDTPNNPPEENPAGGAPDAGGDAFQGFSQDDIDAALAAAEGANTPEDASDAAEAEAPAPSSEDAPVTAESTSGDDIPAPSQADIDAAFAAAESGGDDAAPEASDAPTESEDTALVNDDGSPKLDSQGRPFDDAAAAMAAAIAEEQAASQAAAAAIPPNAQPLELPDFAAEEDDGDGQDIGLLNDVKLDVKIELGRANIYIDEVLKLNKGSVVELDKLAGDPVDVIVNDRLVARGEVLVLNDNFCVRISEILTGQDAEIVSKAGS